MARLSIDGLFFCGVNLWIKAWTNLANPSAHIADGFGSIARIYRMWTSQIDIAGVHRKHISQVRSAA